MTMTKKDLETIIKFLNSVPDDLVMPDSAHIEHTEAGDIATIEWYKDQSNVISVSINDDYSLSYGALIHDRQFYGDAEKANELPDELLKVIKRFAEVEI